MFLPLLLKYFNEEEEQMFYKVDQTTVPSEVDCAGLQSTPCIVVCRMNICLSPPQYIETKKRKTITTITLIVIVVLDSVVM